MKKIYVNRRPKYNKPWGGGILFVNALEKNAEKHGFEVIYENHEEADVVFMMDPRPEGNGSIGLGDLFPFSVKKPSTPIIHRVNEIDSKRYCPIGIDPMLRETSKLSTVSVFVSNWLKKEHEKEWYCENKKVLYNGIDKEVFKNYNNKIKNGKINICTHHWSNDVNKGKRLHEFLDSFVGKHRDRYSFSYIGRPNFIPKNAKVISPLHGEKLAIELSKYDLYMNGSKHDPCPNSVMEAMEVGLPTYVPDFGGGSVELVGEDHTWRRLDQVEWFLRDARFKPNNSPIGTWDECMKSFFGIVGELT